MQILIHFDNDIFCVNKIKRSPGLFRRKGYFKRTVMENKNRMEILLETAKDLSDMTGIPLAPAMMILIQEEHNRNMVKGVKLIADRLEEIINTHQNVLNN